MQGCVDQVASGVRDGIKERTGKQHQIDQRGQTGADQQIDKDDFPWGFFDVEHMVLRRDGFGEVYVESG